MAAKIKAKGFSKKVAARVKQLPKACSFAKASSTHFLALLAICLAEHNAEAGTERKKAPATIQHNPLAELL